MKKFITTITCLCVIAACGTAFAQQGKINPGRIKVPRCPWWRPDVPDAAPFYSNLVNNTCTSCTYSTDNGFFILGPNNCFAPGSTQWISYPFVAGHTGNVKRVTLAITDSGICAAHFDRVYGSDL